MPEFPLRLCHRALHGLLIGHICWKRDGMSAFALDERHCFGQLILGTRDRGYRCACLGQLPGHCAPDATSSAGNDGDLASQINLRPHTHPKPNRRAG